MSDDVVDIEALAKIMVTYRLAEITCGDVTLKKTVHEIEHPQRDPRERPMRRDPMDDEGVDDEVLFYSTQAVHAKVDDLIRQREAAKEPNGGATGL